MLSRITTNLVNSKNLPPPQHFGKSALKLGNEPIKNLSIKEIYDEYLDDRKQYVRPETAKSSLAKLIFIRALTKPFFTGEEYETFKKCQKGFSQLKPEQIVDLLKIGLTRITEGAQGEKKTAKEFEGKEPVNQQLLNGLRGFVQGPSELKSTFADIPQRLDKDFFDPLLVPELSRLSGFIRALAVKALNQPTQIRNEVKETVKKKLGLEAQEVSKLFREVDEPRKEKLQNLFMNFLNINSSLVGN